MRDSLATVKPKVSTNTKRKIIQAHTSHWGWENKKNQSSRDNFSYSSMKTYVVTPHQNSLEEVHISNDRFQR